MISDGYQNQSGPAIRKTRQWSKDLEFQAIRDRSSRTDSPTLHSENEWKGKTHGKDRAWCNDFTIVLASFCAALLLIVARLSMSSFSVADEAKTSKAAELDGRHEELSKGGDHISQFHRRILPVGSTGSSSREENESASQHPNVDHEQQGRARDYQPRQRIHGDDPSSLTTVYLAGIIRDASTIHPKMWSSLMNLNCLHDVGVHILAGRGTRDAMARHDQLKTEMEGETQSCSAPFIIVNEDTNNIYGDGVVDNRIDRIARLRDYQRNLLRSIFDKANVDLTPKDPIRSEQAIIQGSNAIQKEGVVIVADLDLHSLPQLDLLLFQVNNLLDPIYPHDALCAAGITLARKNEPWYYDTFATILHPDTFVHPLTRRLIPHYYEGEDATLVRSNDQFGSFTQGDIMKYFRKEGNQSESGAVSVKSCFGGLTMYRSSIYFMSECRYALTDRDVDPIDGSLLKESALIRYAGSKDKRPCEHVVFHDCLTKQQVGSARDRNVDIAVHPKLLSLWKRDKI